MLTDDDLADLPLRTSRSIDVLQFVPLEQVDPIYFAKSYYLEPDKTGVKPYVLLRDALTDSGKVAVVKVALRQREQLATLRVRDGDLRAGDDALAGRGPGRRPSTSSTRRSTCDRPSCRWPVR